MSKTESWPCIQLFLKANSVTSGTVQSAVVLLCNLSGDTVKNPQQQHQQGTVSVHSAPISSSVCAILMFYLVSGGSELERTSWKIVVKISAFCDAKSETI